MKKVPANPLVKVYSFPRSGTHWLASLMKDCFYSDVSGPYDGECEFYSREGVTKTNPWQQLVGGHDAEPPPSPGRHPVVYVYRRCGMDLVASHYRLNNYYRVGREPVSMEWFLLNYKRPKSELLLVEDWYRSRHLWLASGVRSLAYEDLYADPARELRRLADAFELRFTGALDPAKTGRLVGPVPFPETTTGPQIGRGWELFDSQAVAVYNQQIEQAAKSLGAA